jgi:hypothetical protein
MASISTSIPVNALASWAIRLGQEHAGAGDDAVVAQCRDRGTVGLGSFLRRRRAVDVIRNDAHPAPPSRPVDVFRIPLSYLNPTLRIDRQLAEALRHLADRRAVQQKSAGSRSGSTMARILRLYPHELSGGMRQRVLIAMALAPDPQIWSPMSRRPRSTPRSSTR